MWNCRLQSDGLPHVSLGINGSSLSSNSRGSQSWIGSDRFTNHHHSVSDGVLSYSDSLPDNIQEPRWSPLQKYNLGEVAASSLGGSRPQASWFPSNTERRFALRTMAASPSFGSPSSLSESSHFESTSKRHFAFSNRNFPSRRSYMSKAVYPLVFRNPVSDCEMSGDADVSSTDRLTPVEDLTSPSRLLDNSSTAEYKFRKTLSDLQKLDMSPDPNISYRREGFRWSSASSNDSGLDGDRFEVAEHMDVETLRSPTCAVPDQKCGVCVKLLRQKSPWSSHRIMRGGDMPIAGILPCGHVFHAECLEQVTPKTQIHEPPCPLCLRTIGPNEESASVSEPLRAALRSIRGSRGVAISEPLGSHSHNEASAHIKDRLRKNWLHAALHQNRNGSSLTDRLKRHFTFGRKSGKDIFRPKMFHKRSSSSSQEVVRHQMSMQ